MIAAIYSPIYIGFLLLSSLLLWFILEARGKWWLKAALILIVPVFMIVVWFSLASFNGWPTTSKPPKTALFVYGYAIEPDANVGLKGAIYVWLIPAKAQNGALDYHSKIGEPRAYVLRYSKQLESEVHAANKAVASGKRVGFEMTKKSGAGKAGRNKPSSGSGGRRSGGTYHLYNLRPPVLPPKGAQ